jgi:tripartite-type tricarboxylate transporter receptor subunit TctC
MWYGFLAPKGTPRAVVDKLDDEFRAILALPDVKKNFSAQGMDAASSTPAEFAALMRREDGRWAEIIRKNRISAE